MEFYVETSTFNYMKFFSKERLWLYMPTVLIFSCRHWNSVIDWTRFYLWECQVPNWLCYTSLLCAVFKFWMEMHLWFSRINFLLAVSNDLFYFYCLTKELELSLFHFCCFTVIAECRLDWVCSLLYEYAWSENAIKSPLSSLSVPGTFSIT